MSIYKNGNPFWGDIRKKYSATSFSWSNKFDCGKGLYLMYATASSPSQGPFDNWSDSVFIN